jgi:hypothetical protein
VNTELQQKIGKSLQAIADKYGCESDQEFINLRRQIGALLAAESTLAHREQYLIQIIRGASEFVDGLRQHLDTVSDGGL